MQIERIEIMKLFGMFDHDIKLKTLDRITVIHGPNGVGKTTILKLLKDIFDANFFALDPVPFSKIIITFANKLKLNLIKKRKKSIDISLKKGRQIVAEVNIHLSTPKDFPHGDFPISIIEEVVPRLHRIGSRSWRDSTTGERLTLNDVIFKFGDELPFDFGKTVHIPEKIKRVLFELKTYFIQTQRLLLFTKDEEFHVPRRGIRTQNTVEQYSLEMAEMLQEKLRQSGSVAASLDRTFPHRLLDSDSPKEATQENIREKYQSQSKYRGRLMKAGLIDEEEQVSLPESEISANDLKVLWFYLSDIDEKLKVFDPLLNKVELFNDIINSRFLYKSFALNKSDGFVFTLDSEKKVPLNCLSSGEQHELVLTYELLFKVPEKSFIMIDEPELSLHVTWQHKFLNDIERISNLADLDFLIATHSPSIIHDRRSLMVPLPKGVNSNA